MSIPVTPLGNNVLVEIVISGAEKERKSAGGIIISVKDAEMETRSDLVEILKISEDAFINCFGEKHPPSNDQKYAFIQRNTGQPFGYQNKKYRLVPSDHILGTLTKEFAIEYCKSAYDIDLTLINKNND